MAADSSTSAQRRRATKPLIEKRRRARINSSLAQLKEMVAKPTNNAQETRSNRLEKADILEMTVEYVKKVHNRKSFTDNSCHVTPPDPDRSFKEGYRLCMSEVQNFFSKHYRQQASKQYINRSLQNYLQQTFQSALNETDSSPLTNASVAEFASSTKCDCRNATGAESDVEILKKNEYLEIQSENSDFGCTYSSASTDDEMTENYAACENETNNKFLLNGGIYRRPTTHCSRNDDVNSSDRMWRPW